MHRFHLPEKDPVSRVSHVGSRDRLHHGRELRRVGEDPRKQLHFEAVADFDAVAISVCSTGGEGSQMLPALSFLAHGDPSSRGQPGASI